ncbi:MAG: hypothetical protein PHN17_02995 [Syntrophaceticus sp.]|nr:hypothetical protein [Syntrophaceticus sp.]
MLTVTVMSSGSGDRQVARSPGRQVPGRQVPCRQIYSSQTVGFLAESNGEIYMSPDLQFARPPDLF